MEILNFLFGPFSIWSPIVFTYVIFLLLAAHYLLKGKRRGEILKINFFTESRLVYGLIGGGLVFSLFLTGAQYYVWSSSALGRFFLPPYQPLGYFLHYSFLHFWLAGLLSLIAASIFYLVFKAVNKYNPEAIGNQEIGLGFLVCLLVGWPRMIILLPLFFLIMLLVLSARKMVFKSPPGQGTRITWPFMIAAFFTLLFGYYLIEIFHLSALIA